MLIASATAIGFLLAGCSSGTTAVIGVPSSASPVNEQPVNSIDTAINLAIVAELAQATQTASDGSPALVQVELNALTSTKALAQYEAFSALQAIAANQIAKREGLVNALIADVKGNKYLSGIEPAGRSLSGSLLSILGGVDGRLSALAVKIATDSLPDVLRSDVVGIGPSSRVAGVYEPMTHLAIAGGDELYELGLLSSQQQKLAGEVATGLGSDPNYAQEAPRLSDLATSIASARATINAALGAVMSLSPGGYPANKATIVSVRTALIQLRTPLGKIGEANADANAIVDLLASR
jgi:hypothetical protein